MTFEVNFNVYIISSDNINKLQFFSFHKIKKLLYLTFFILYIVLKPNRRCCTYDHM